MNILCLLTLSVYDVWKVLICVKLLIDRTGNFELQEVNLNAVLMCNLTLDSFSKYIAEV